MEGGWDQLFGLDSRAQGTGMTDEEARTLRLPPLADFRTYMAGVWAATDDYLAGVTREDLQRLVVVRPVGEQPAIDAIANMCLSHGLRHLGEIEYARGLFGLQGAAGI